MIYKELQKRDRQEIPSMWRQRRRWMGAVCRCHVTCPGMELSMLANKDLQGRQAYLATGVCDAMIVEAHSHGAAAGCPELASLITTDQRYWLRWRHR
jgi:hypothetical protein